VLSANAAAIRLYHAAGFQTSRQGVRDDGAAFELMRASLPPTVADAAAALRDVP
jgi:hypothetical protein